MPKEPRNIARSVERRALADRDVTRAVELDEEYVGMGKTKIIEWRTARPNWFRGAYLDDELIGICCGNEREPGAVVLQSIAVMVEHWRGGIGSLLIRDFEAAVFSTGITKISLASASDGPTESFYLKNRYRATHVLLFVAPDFEEPSPDQALPMPDKVVDKGDEVRLSFPIDKYSPSTRDELKRAYQARQGLFIFEKTPSTAV